MDATTAHLHYFNVASGLTKTADDVDDFYMYRLYGWSREERDQIFAKYGVDIHRESLPYPNALQNLEEMYRRHKVSFITARPEFCQDVTVEWFKYYNVNYHHLSFTEDKLAECQALGIDVLIDDAPHYAEQFVQSNQPFILYDQPYNRHIHHELIYRARNWMEVMQHIADIEKDRVNKRV